MPVYFQIPFQGGNKIYSLQTDSILNSPAGVILGAPGTQTTMHSEWISTNSAP